MAAKGKFVMDRRVVGQIAKTDGALAAAVVDAASEVAGEIGPGATIDTYTTDRKVAGVVVPAHRQARDGVATRAAQRVASRPTGTTSPGTPAGFRSQAQWRWYYANRPGMASSMARRSSPYRSLPRRVGV